MKKYFLLLLLSFAMSQSQDLTHNNKIIFSHQDSLRGNLNENRIWWDVQHYNLDIAVNPKDSTITGFNEIEYLVLKSNNVMQIDLQAPMQISKIVQNSKLLTFKRDGNAFMVNLIEPQLPDSKQKITIFFSGKPKVAKNPPWDGGITWKKTKDNRDFIASSCQGLGASVWWPNKDHLSDEPQSGVHIQLNVSDGYTAVSNGRLKETKSLNNGTKTFYWQVQNPINNYNISVNIADYASFSEVFKGEKGNLDCTYYVLKDNLPKAKEQFKQVGKMLTAFEHWFGPYPFYEDGYKLVETPFLGMEHQSGIAYGNGYQNGYRGRDLSDSGWGLLFDFIIIHESGHEWFGNNISNRDIADMWIHESFTNYSESLYLEYYYGKKAAQDYIIGIRKNIENDKPIIGNYHVNNEGSSDMYYKGANMLHTLRQFVPDDEKWRAILRGLNSTFYHQTVNTQQIETYLTKEVGTDLTAFFDQYLRHIEVPNLEYYCKNKELYFRWSNCITGFDMPVRLKIGDAFVWLKPKTTWATIPIKNIKTTIAIDENFYCNSIQLKPKFNN
jgi:aminopeptidase N